MRLDKFVCKSTPLTKSDAIARILAGEVSVNNQVTIDGAVQVHENNTILLNGVPLTLRPFRYIMMHKPSGTICSNIDEQYPSVFNHLSVNNIDELHIAGRLDSDTTGLLLITDDGRWSFNITQPTSNCPKVYRVMLSRPIDESAISVFKEGIKLQGEAQLTRPAKLEIINDKEVLLTITEGKFHQVKRMIAAIGNRVHSLHREAIGPVTLDINVGQWRYLTDEETHSLIN